MCKILIKHKRNNAERVARVLVGPRNECDSAARRLVYGASAGLLELQAGFHSQTNSYTGLSD